MSDTPKQNDWTKPAAMAIPKEGYFKLEQGRYGPIFPRPLRAMASRSSRRSSLAGSKPSASTARRSRRRWRATRTASQCSSCTTCAGCSSTSRGRPTSCIRASSTPTSTSTPRMPWLSSRRPASPRSSKTSRASRGLEDERAGVHQVRPRTPVPELSGIRGVPVRERRGDQEGAQAEGGVLQHARPDAVIQSGGHDMLEFDDIQHILLDPRASAHRTIRVSVVSERCRRAGLAGRHPRNGAVGQQARASVEKDNRWVTVAFTWNGLRALGVDEASLATFPEEFKQGMVARAEILGDTGANHPDNWVGGLASPDLHAIVILFARDDAERERCQAEHEKFIAQCDGVEVLSSLDLEATPPFDYAHDHFGYRDRLSQPVIEGIGRGADARLRRAAEGGRVHPRLPGRRRSAGQSAAARDPLPQRQLHGLSPAAGACRRVSRLSARARPDARGAGTRRREAHGPLAQRRAARAGAGQGRSGARRRSAAEQ